MEIVPECADTVSRLPPPFLASVSPGPGREVRNGIGWTSLEKTAGHGTAVGPQTGKQCWSLLSRLWRAIAPLMKPRCAEGDVPTAANLNLVSEKEIACSNNEPLCGDHRETKLIVPVNFRTQALFRWKGKSSSKQ